MRISASSPVVILERRADFTPCSLGRLDELRPVVPDAVHPRADDSWCQDRLRQGVKQVLDVIFVSQVRVQPFSESVARENDRGTVVDVPQDVLGATFQLGGGGVPSTSLASK